LDTLIINSPNPGNEYYYVTFSLNRIDGKVFFVNTMNFSTIKASDEARYVNSFKVLTDEGVVSQSVTPLINKPTAQDTGIIIFKPLKTITGYQYSWNQKGKWQNDKDNIPELYKISYKFKPEVSPSIPTHYNGYGFWICGISQIPKDKFNLTPVDKSKFYIDQAK
jgi:hypothetical protein